MEEILASIRRIIADDQEELRVVETARQAETTSFRTFRESGEGRVIPLALPEERDALEPFDLPVAMPEEDTPSVETRLAVAEEAAPRDVAKADLTSARSPELPDTAPADTPSRPQDNLLSGAAGACVADAFGRLGATLLEKSPATMEDFVAELLRPLLRDWLDENLPSLVERLVQAEIERVSRGRR